LTGRASWWALVAVGLGSGACIVVPNADYGREDLESETGEGDGDADGEGDGDADGDDDGDGDGDGDGPLACDENEAPEGGACPARCDTCADGVCSIVCDDDQGCDTEVLECPPGWDCEVSCVAKQACKEMIVVCPTTQACRMRCAGTQACERAELSCAQGTCELVCDAGDQVCKSAVLHCGANSSQLHCAGEQEGLLLDPRPGSSCPCLADETCFGDD
jgi:hypothetical protein